MSSHHKRERDKPLRAEPESDTPTYWVACTEHGQLTACIVDEKTILGAVRKAHDLGIVCHGVTNVVRLPRNAQVDPEFRERLLSHDEALKLRHVTLPTRRERA
jgi:hypothetical protein